MAKASTETPAPRTAPSRREVKASADPARPPSPASLSRKRACFSRKSECFFAIAPLLCTCAPQAPPRAPASRLWDCELSPAARLKEGGMVHEKHEKTRKEDRFSWLFVLFVDPIRPFTQPLCLPAFLLFPNRPACPSPHALKRTPPKEANPLRLSSRNDFAQWSVGAPARPL